MDKKTLQTIDKLIYEALDTSAISQLNPSLASKFQNRQELFTQLAQELDKAPEGMKGKVLSSLVKNLGLSDDFEDLQNIVVAQTNDEEENKEESPFAPASE